eukprot:CAMPEP_0115153238 /NCGR_PEP_ID=MMETSP0227-20121206/66611_1 /TAXON_ID=89957 /ORGANISM="Polarella glacialis, Strain CCMP 1383" /LENGTH=158 /DNA_ID=CAMNT_0002563947 /DNA_START=3 /DNA_END=479 /DNA_ORIENTATION=+
MTDSTQSSTSSTCPSLSKEGSDRPGSGRSEGRERLGLVSGASRKRPRGLWEVHDQPPATRWRKSEVDAQDQAPDFQTMSSVEMNDYVRWWRKMHAKTWQSGGSSSASSQTANRSHSAMVIDDEGFRPSESAGTGLRNAMRMQLRGLGSTPAGQAQSHG